VLAEPKGLFPARGGRAAGGRGVANGLFPPRGALALTVGAIGGVGAVGTTVGFGAAAIFLSIISCNAASISGVISGVVAAFFAAVFFAAAFLAGAFFAGFSSAGFATTGYFSNILRTTGASTVDDAERTNSPISWSFARTSLLSIPKSFANS
jgi:hypothetical protein